MLAIVESTKILHSDQKLQEIPKYTSDVRCAVRTEHYKYFINATKIAIHATFANSTRPFRSVFWNFPSYFCPSADDLLHNDEVMDWNYMSYLHAPKNLGPQFSVSPALQSSERRDLSTSVSQQLVLSSEHS